MGSAMKNVARPVSAALAPEGIFVVHLSTASAIPQRQLEGRVEHVMSGDSKRFHSLADMLAFMARCAGAGDGDGGAHGPL